MLIYTKFVLRDWFFENKKHFKTCSLNISIATILKRLTQIPLTNNIGQDVSPNNLFVKYRKHC